MNKLELLSVRLGADLHKRSRYFYTFIDFCCKGKLR